MSPQERTEIVQILESSREVFNSACAGVAEEHAKSQPAPDRWSVLDCVEHVTFVEQRVLGRMEQTAPGNAPAVDKQKEAHLAARLPDRTERVMAPEAIRPAGRYASLAEALEQFNAARTRTIEFAQARGEDVYALALEHPRFGKLNGMEFLVLIAGHARRHAEQIREARAALGIA